MHTSVINFLLVVSIDWCAVLVEWFSRKVLCLSSGFDVLSLSPLPPPHALQRSLSPAAHNFPHTLIYTPHSRRGGPARSLRHTYISSYISLSSLSLEFFESFGQTLLNTIGWVGKQAPKRITGPLSWHRSAGRAAPFPRPFSTKSEEKVSRPCYL